MKKIIIIILLFCSSLAQAQTPPNNMNASPTIVGTQIVWCPVGSTADYKCTFNQIATFIQSTLGSAALANTGTSGATLGLLNTANTWSAAQTFSAITLTGATGCAQFTGGVLGSTGSACGGSGSTGANPTATAGPTVINGSASTFMRSDAAPAIQLGSSSQAGLLQCGSGTSCSAGVITATGSSSGANPTATAGPTAINGSATTFMRSDASPAIQLGTSTQKGIVQVDGTTITASAGVISAVGGSGAVSSVTGGVGVTVTPTTGAVIVSSPASTRNNTTTSDAILTTDAGLIVTENNASAVAATIAQAGTTGFAASQPFTVKNLGAGLVTITPTTSTIGGFASISLATQQSIDFYSDGTNYVTLPSKTSIKGTATLGISAIASGACATVVTVAAVGITTTTTLTASFNGDPTAVTGYIPSTNGLLSIFVYPTSGNANFKVCNTTSASITPGAAVTLNWAAL